VQDEECYQVGPVAPKVPFSKLSDKHKQTEQRKHASKAKKVLKPSKEGMVLIYQYCMAFNSMNFCSSSPQA
jgi:hypothetical protein